MAVLRPSFVPPHEVRVLRDYTRTRIDLTRTRIRSSPNLQVTGPVVSADRRHGKVRREGYRKT